MFNIYELCHMPSQSLEHITVRSCSKDVHVENASIYVSNHHFVFSKVSLIDKTHVNGEGK